MSGVEFAAGGVTYRLRLGLAAMRRYSEAVGRAMPADMERLENFGTDPEVPAILCDLFWVALAPQPPREAVADLIDEVGLKEALLLFQAASAQAFPQPPEAAPGN